MALFLIGYLGIRAYSGTTAPQAPADASYLALNEYDHRLGSPDAEYTLIYHIDYDCPYCTDSIEHIREVVRDYPSVQVVVRHLPLLDLHPEAFKKAVLAECFAARGYDFFDVSAFLLAYQGTPLSEMVWKAPYTKEDALGCLDDTAAQEKVLVSQRNAGFMGLYTTPSAALLKDGAMRTYINFMSQQTLRSVLDAVTRE